MYKILYPPSGSVKRMTIMNKWLILILIFGMACAVSLATAASCPSCCCEEDGCPCPLVDCEKCFEKLNHPDPCPECLCPFEDRGFCTPIPGIDDEDSGDIVISDPTGTVRVNFTADTTTGDAPLTVHFTDTSSGDPNVWTWDFDDGTNSALQNPTHTFPMPGNYTINFMAKKYTKEGTTETIVSARIIRPDYIVVTGQPSLSGASGAEETTPAISSPSQSTTKTPRIIQPIIMSPSSYTMWGGYVVLPLYYGTSNPVLTLPVSTPTNTAYTKAGLFTTDSVQTVPLSGSYISVNPVSIPINFFLVYSLPGIGGQGS
jgi:hypothetical protein